MKVVCSRRMFRDTLSIPCIVTLTQILDVIYAMLDPHHFNSWYLIGTTSWVMVDLCLHHDPHGKLPSQTTRLES